MAKHGRGLICLALTAERCEELGLNLMAAKNEAPLQTAFTVTIEAARGRHHRDLGRTTAPARSRSRSTPTRGPEDLRQPGHVFPLKAKDGGVLERTGHTEASIDLARLAGPDPGRRDLRDHERGRDDGAGPRPRPTTAERHDLKMVTVADLIAYRRRTEKLVERIVSTKLPTGFGEFTRRRLPLAGRRQAPRRDGQGRGRRRREDVLVRVHSRVPDRRRLPLACAATAASSSRRRSRRSSRRASGVLLYLSQEGRGIGLLNKLARLQAAGGGARHRRRQPQARPARRPARLRDRRPDPRGPRADQHPHPHQQPEEDHRPRGLRPLGHRAGADPGGPQPPQRGLPEDQAREDGPHPPPPGPRRSTSR